MGRGRIRLDPQRRIVMLAGLGVPALVLERPPQREVDPRPLLLRQDQGAFEVGDGLGRILALHIELGQEFLEGRVGRVELDGPLQPGQGVVELAVADQGQAEVRLCLGQVGLEPQRLQVR